MGFSGLRLLVTCLSRLSTLKFSFSGLRLSATCLSRLPTLSVYSEIWLFWIKAFGDLPDPHADFEIWLFWIMAFGDLPDPHADFEIWLFWIKDFGNSLDTSVITAKPPYNRSVYASPLKRLGFRSPRSPKGSHGSLHHIPARRNASHCFIGGLERRKQPERYAQLLLKFIGIKIT